MDREIRAKIIALISTAQVVINKGKNDEIKEGMIFAIKLELPEISDPEDANNLLKGIFYEKGKIKIKTVFERMSFADIQPSVISSSITTMLRFDVKEYKYPDVAGKTLISLENWKIRVGDEVVLIEEPKSK